MAFKSMLGTLLLLLSFLGPFQICSAWTPAIPSSAASTHRSTGFAPLKVIGTKPVVPRNRRLGKHSSSSSSSLLLIPRNFNHDATTTCQSMADDSSSEGDNNKKQGLWARVKGYFLLKEKKDDGLTFKQRLAKMGVATVLSYGMISNLSYAILVALAWYGSSVKVCIVLYCIVFYAFVDSIGDVSWKRREDALNWFSVVSILWNPEFFILSICLQQTGLSPLTPGQWKNFLAVYGGFWMFNNIIRPLRLGLSIAIAPSLDKLVLFFQNKLKISKPLAITVTVIFVNVIGTTLFMCGGIAGASLLAGVPIFPPKWNAGMGDWESELYCNVNKPLLLAS